VLVAYTIVMGRQHKKKKPYYFIFLYLLQASVLLIITWVVSPILLQPNKNLKPLPPLTIPQKRPTLSLTEPLIIQQPFSNILGSEPIDPRDIITYVNSERIKRGIPPLKTNEKLASAATMRANVIMRYQNFSHQDPYEHIELKTVLPLVNYPYIYASENIGMGGDSGMGFVTGFMNSTMHRENLLNPELKETGVGIVSGPYRNYYVNVAVQLFAHPTDATSYAGYSSEDIKQYTKFAADIGQQLVTVAKIVGTDPEKKEYKDKWQTLLLRQQEILAILLTEMKNGRPFTENLTMLIEEYNQNWLRVPNI